MWACLALHTGALPRDNLHSPGLMSVAPVPLPAFCAPLTLPPSPGPLLRLCRAACEPPLLLPLSLLRLAWPAPLGFCAPDHPAGIQREQVTIPSKQVKEDSAPSNMLLHREMSLQDVQRIESFSNVEVCTSPRTAFRKALQYPFSQKPRNEASHVMLCMRDSAVHPLDPSGR